jgi:HSP20 family protein
MGKKNIGFFEVEISKNFPSGISTHVDWEPSTNIIEVGNLIIIEVELPGVKKDDINIVLQGNRELIIRGIKNQPRLNEENVTYYLFDREFGNFYKKIVIDFPLDPESIKSSMENGVLTIEISKRQTKKIAVKIK